MQAWRRAFSRMGLKPTQYRCASEALLRRLRQEGSLPRRHPLVDLCNALSAAFAIPVAAFDVARISGDLEVRPADGTERYLTFGGEIETPIPAGQHVSDAHPDVSHIAANSLPPIFHTSAPPNCTTCTACGSDPQT
nr:phenylalanine--tRNA ligase beta subunit-related protein [Elioraea sp.]